MGKARSQVIVEAKTHLADACQELNSLGHPDLSAALIELTSRFVGREAAGSVGISQGHLTMSLDRADRVRERFGFKA